MLRLIQITTLVKDSTLPYTPQPSNYINFNANGTLEYKFNSPTLQTGTYEFIGMDSIYAKIGGTQYRWQNLLLTTEIFNVKYTNGNAPGTTIHTYQSFAR